jgi:Tol biopolymer transport system component
MSRYRNKLFLSLLQILGLVLLPALSFPQSDSETKKIFAQAESYYLYGEYELANELYLLLDAPDNSNVKYKIGVCYLNIPGEKDKSVAYLEEAVKNANYESKEGLYKEKRAPLDVYYSLAKAYMINNDPEKGMNTFKTFNRLASETKGGMQNLEFVNQQIQACNNAISFRENPVLFSRKILGDSFTTGSINENPAVSYDGNTIVFTEKRGIVNSIWFSKNISGIWQSPVEITSQLNAGSDCSTCCLNRDGTELFLYKTDDYDGAIYSSRFVNDSWTPIVRLNKNINSRFYESHAAVSADGRKLYFTSNREGGYGELDIYVSEKGVDGEWGVAKNLGPTINTSFNEDTPFITLNDSLLYFSSEGHDSMGGFDIFFSSRSDSSWLVPVNLGFPLNTADDDKFLQPAKNGSNAYYSLSTDYKKKDIFYLAFGENPYRIKGIVSLSDTIVLFDNNYRIYLTDGNSGDTLSSTSPETHSGNYNFSVRPGRYKLIFKGAGYNEQKIDTILPDNNPLSELYINVMLNRNFAEDRPTPSIEYEKISLENIPVIDIVDSARLVLNMNVTDDTELPEKEENILFYTVQVIALYNPVDVSYFKHIDDLKIMYNDKDKFYRYITGEFLTREDAHRLRLSLISKGYPEEIFVKKVTSNKP